MNTETGALILLAAPELETGGKWEICVFGPLALRLEGTFQKLEKRVE